MNLFDFNSEEMIIDEENKILKFKNFGDESVENLFTLKPFDFNRKYIDDEFICKQYKKLEKILDFKIRFKKPIQTHTNIVKILDEENFEDDFNDVDGLITQMKGVGLASSSADCQAVIFYDVKNKVIGNVHSGWKGTLNKIVENTVLPKVGDINIITNSKGGYQFLEETQVEDIEVFGKNGYRIEEIECFDQFPSAGYVETIVLLSKKQPST